MQSACSILSSVARPAVQTFPLCVIKGTILEKIVIELRMCVFYVLLTVYS